MHVRRGFINWGIFLICVGAVPLAVQLNVIDRDTASSLLRLWPFILIGIGLGLLLRFSRAQALGGLVVAATFGVLVGVFFAAGFPSAGVACGNSQASGPAISRSGPMPDGFTHMEFSCADVTLTRTSAPVWAVEVVAGNRPTIDASSELNLKSAGNRAFFMPVDGRENWRIELPDSSFLTLYLTMNASSGNIRLGEGTLGMFNPTLNASDAVLDLRGAATGHGAPINATLNASSASLILPNAPVSGNLTLNASSLDVCVAPDVGLRITYDDTLSSQNFADAGLTQSGKTWQSANYSSATARAELHVSANVSTTTLNPVGGCQ